MRLTISPQVATAGFLAVVSSAVLLTGCSSPRPLPKYERPLAHTRLQTVRTTAYTHTEADHIEYTNHNALGGTLHAAGPPVVPAATPVAQSPEAALPASIQPRGEAVLPADAGDVGFQRASYTMPATPVAYVPRAVVYGSAAADWSRWPAGTVFRIIPTGQLYKVDDYGWALSGRNTIDLYMPTRGTMNSWGVRNVPIEVVEWGDPGESLRRLRNHQKYRHIKRMVLELEGHHGAAARLR